MYEVSYFVVTPRTDTIATQLSVCPLHALKCVPLELDFIFVVLVVYYTYSFTSTLSIGLKGQRMH
jgi:hypothetical protein